MDSEKTIKEKVCDLIGTPEKFTQWLENEYVDLDAVRSLTDSCPIARFLHLKIEVVGSGIDVYERCVMVGDNDAYHRVNTPEWVVKFVRAIDRSGKYKSRIKGATAARVCKRAVEEADLNKMGDCGPEVEGCC